jgi:hypothetical protein
MASSVVIRISELTVFAQFPGLRTLISKPRAAHVVRDLFECDIDLRSAPSWVPSTHNLGNLLTEVLGAD